MHQMFCRSDCAVADGLFQFIPKVLDGRDQGKLRKPFFHVTGDTDVHILQEVLMCGTNKKSKLTLDTGDNHQI